MTQLFFSTVLKFVVGSVLGYCLNSMRNYKNKLNQKEKESKILKDALMTILQNNLTNTYYKYAAIEENTRLCI